MDPKVTESMTCLCVNIGLSNDFQMCNEKVSQWEYMGIWIKPNI